MAHLRGGGSVRVHGAFSESPRVLRLPDVPGYLLDTGRRALPLTPAGPQSVPARRYTGNHLFRGVSVFSPRWLHMCSSAQTEFGDAIA